MGVSLESCIALLQFECVNFTLKDQLNDKNSLYLVDALNCTAHYVHKYKFFFNF